MEADEYGRITAREHWVPLGKKVILRRRLSSNHFLNTYDRNADGSTPEFSVRIVA